MKLLHTCTAIAALAAVPFAAAAASDTVTRPSIYAPTSLASASPAPGQLRSGARVGGQTGKKSFLDGNDTTTDLILIGASGAVGYFARDIFDDNDHHDNDSSPN